MRRSFSILVLALWCTSYSAVVQAQQPVAQAPSVPAPRWYGAPILIGGELAVAALGAETFIALDGHHVPPLLWVPTLGAYLLTGPIVHLLNHEPENAAASLGLNVVSPIIGFAIGFSTLMFAGGCDNGFPHAMGPPCSRAPFWTFSALGFMAAPLLDGLLIARSSVHPANDEPGAWHPTFIPIVSPNGREGVMLGVGGFY